MNKHVAYNAINTDVRQLGGGMLKYGIILGIFSAILSVVALSIFKKASIAIPIGCGGISGLIMTHWFARYYKRVPTENESKVVTITYGVFMTIVTLSPALLTQTYTAPGLLSLGIYVLAYIGFFAFIFNEKQVTTQLQKNA